MTASDDDGDAGLVLAQIVDRGPVIDPRASLVGRRQQAVREAEAVDLCPPL
jgi:hypothetical protein